MADPVVEPREAKSEEPKPPMLSEPNTDLVPNLAHSLLADDDEDVPHLSSQKQAIINPFV